VRGRLCLLCTSGFSAEGLATLAQSITRRSRRGVRVLLVDEVGRPREGVEPVVLEGRFLEDVLKVMAAMSPCGRVRVYIADASPYQAVVTATAATLMYERVEEIAIECRVTPYEICVGNAALTHALGGREGRVVKLRIIELCAGRCVTLDELSRKLRLSSETVLRHVYRLSTAGLIKMMREGGNPLICGNVSENAAALAKAVRKAYEALTRR